MENTGVTMKEVAMMRNMGFWQIWAVGVGSVVGDGIFLYLGQGIQQGGPSALLAFIMAGFVQMFIMLALGELSVGMPSAGAMTDWVNKYLGRFWGLMSGLTFSVGWVIIGGSVSIALGRMTCYWFPSLNLELGTVLFAAIFFTVFCLLNVMGTGIAGKTQLVLVGILMLIMIGFSVVGFIKGIDTTAFTPFFAEGFKGFTSVIPIATYAFMGAACICTTGSECKNPVDLGKALVWASLTFIVVYCAALAVVLGTIDWHSASMDVSPFTQAAKVIFGSVGASIVNMAGWIAAATSVLMGSIYTPSRIFYSMAKKGYLPRALGKISAKTKTPVFALVTIWVVGMIGIGAAYFAGSSNFYITLSNQATIAWMVSWGLAVIAGIKYHREIGSANIKKVVGWKMPLYPLMPVLALCGIVYVLYLSLYDVYQFIGLGIWLGVYCIYYWRINTKIKRGEISGDLDF